MVLGDLSIQGNIKGIDNLTELMQIALDNGARYVLVATAHKRQALDLKESLLELAEFYNDPKGAVAKAVRER